MRKSSRVAAALIACAAMGFEFAALAGFSGAMLGTMAVSAQAADTLKVERRRVRPRVIVRRGVYADPMFRTNHVPGVWRGEARLPWVGPGLCHDARVSERIYCILW